MMIMMMMIYEKKGIVRQFGYLQELYRDTQSTKHKILQSPHYYLLSIHKGPLTLRRLMSYIYGAPILDVSRSHTTTQHSR